MIDMAPQRNREAMEMGERGVFPMVRMGVGQKHRMNGRPRQAGRRQASGELPRSQTDVDEHAEVAVLHQAGVAAAAARQSCEPQADLSFVSRSGVAPSW